MTGGNILLWIALASFLIGLAVVVVDFALDSDLSIDGRNAFIALVALAVIVVIIAVILGKVAP